MKKYIKRISAHVCSNRGDGYILFCMVVLAAVIFFSAIFGILKIRVEATTIYDQVENAADFIISEMKEDSYQALIKGDTAQSALTYSEGIDARQAELISDIAHMLSYDDEIDILTPTEFIRNNERGNVQYKLYGADISYNDVSGIIEMTIMIDIPVYLNGKLLATNTEKLVKTTSFNFKDR